jgi:hypothetical protein
MQRQAQAETLSQACAEISSHWVDEKGKPKKRENQAGTWQTATRNPLPGPLHLFNLYHTCAVGLQGCICDAGLRPGAPCQSPLLSPLLRHHTLFTLFVYLLTELNQQIQLWWKENANLNSRTHLILCLILSLFFLPQHLIHPPSNFSLPPL